ncbi:crotonase/enoyl-CoA hydratase family protein [Leifsonia shinshuensis]|uniref:Crotonase/enoyl-CoA hydratase family protein n=1 Tax=Leifsonia shinshuensis TaxID=150026 RepID=A0A7G6Y8M9_9MICO|nr:crotonase/enoyl-CoA hydratase family protein [Leifsonia shinshuensis]QNE34844.1 crotonase/enoyl-CoA hydratase family protein [Leifsonia shinshuensis]
MSEPKILTERRGHVLLIGLNRPEKRNAADYELLNALAEAYGELDRDPELRVGVVHAIGDHFTGGLDLADVGPRIGPEGLSFIGDSGVDPWGVSGPRVRKPVVVAVQGTCLTLGIELILAADVAVAARSTTFAQIEVARGILPFGGATIRFPRAAGWGNAMRYILTGDPFDAAEAYRMGLVQQVVDDGAQLDAALAIADRIAAQAPLAVQATLANAVIAVRDGDAAAEAALQPELVRMAGSEDARIGMQAFLTRTPAEFVGR